jgi:hypothetical protein
MVFENVEILQTAEQKNLILENINSLHWIGAEKSNIKK